MCEAILRGFGEEVAKSKECGTLVMWLALCVVPLLLILQENSHYQLIFDLQTLGEAVTVDPTYGYTFPQHDDDVIIAFRYV